MNDETTKLIEQNRQSIAELQRQISVMEAALAGKTILAKPRYQGQYWAIIRDPTWRWEITDYKVAPRPRTIYVAQSGFGDKELYGIPYFSVDECVKSNACPPENVVKFVEVIE